MFSSRLVADVLVDEAYAQKAMPDLGLEIEDFQAQTWRIENWSQQAKRIVGPEFSCGGHKWCVHEIDVTLGDGVVVRCADKATIQADPAISSRKCEWTTK